jgi:F-type H+-transporting ATPase subunit delta
MKNISAQDYAIALYEITTGASKAELEKVISAFVQMLFKAGKLKQADKIIKEFIRYSKKQAGIIDITITTARDIDAKTVALIKSAFGKSVEAELLVDPAQLGGIKIKTENTILDGSLRTQLLRLKQQLI